MATLVASLRPETTKTQKVCDKVGTKWMARDLALLGSIAEECLSSGAVFADCLVLPERSLDPFFPHLHRQ